MIDFPEPLPDKDEFDKRCMYYYELKNGSGSFKAESDQQVEEWKKQWQLDDNLLIVYRESPTPDGLPFVEI